VAIRRRHFQRLERVFNDKSGRAFLLMGRSCNGRADIFSEPETWVAEALEDAAINAEALRDPVVFRPVSVNPWIYGVHFVDKLLGATVFDLDGTGNWQAAPLQSKVGTLAEPDIEAAPAWILARRIASAFRDARVTVPLFAPPVLSSPFNIAMNLYGQEFLIALLEDPVGARRDLRVITELILTLHRWFIAAIPFEQLQMIETHGRIQPPGHGQICGCSCQLLPPDLYRDFIAPCDDAILSLYPEGGMIHLCGAHTQHLPVWRAMRSLRAVQLNDRAAFDLPVYFAQLRRNQVCYVNPSQEMPPKRIMDITGGRRVVIVSDGTL
jgi:hypothetical protein